MMWFKVLLCQGQFFGLKLFSSKSFQNPPFAQQQFFGSKRPLAFSEVRHRSTVQL